MAELREADKRAILGENYRAPVATEETRAAEAAARRTSIRNVAVGIAVLALMVALAVFLGKGR
jgi:hypothetical protein